MTSPAKRLESEERRTAHARHHPLAEASAALNRRLLDSLRDLDGERFRARHGVTRSTAIRHLSLLGLYARGGR